MKKAIVTILACAMLLTSVIGFGSAAEAIEGELIAVGRYGLQIDRNAKLILGIPGTVTAGELSEMFEESDQITVLVGEAVLKSDEAVPNGATVTNGFDSAAAVIYGDTNCDARFTLADVMLTLKHVAGWSIELDSAADVDCDGDVTLSDAVMMLKKLAGWRVWLGNAGMTVATEPVIAANEDSAITLGFGNGIDKYSKTDGIGSDFTDVLYCARGEIEFTQFALATEEDRSGLSVEITQFTNARGETVRTELYKEDFITANDQDSGAVASVYADIMNPVVTGFKLKSGSIQPFGIKAYPDEDSAAGLYEAVISVTDKDGAELKRALVFLTVWDFTLPENSYCRTSFGLAPSAIGTSKTLSQEERYKSYYDMFIENRMNPVLLPYDITDERAEEYMDDPRVNSFLAGGDGYGGMYDTTDQQLTDRYDVLSRNKTWLDKAYFYYDDEPLNFETEGKATVQQQIDSIRNNYEHARSLFPNAKLVIPNHYNDFDERFGDDIVGYVMRYSSILCPHSWMFNTFDNASDNVWYDKDNDVTDKLGTLKERIDAKLESDPDAEFWWYTSDNPRDGMCNIYVSKPGIEHRTLFWQQYLYGADGYLYWLSNEWSDCNSRNTVIFDQYAGILCYNNTVYGVETPVSSVRMEMIRDGIEDFDYLHMIEDALGKEVADSFVSRITSGLLVYNTDFAVLEAVRLEMGELLQDLYS